MKRSDVVVVGGGLAGIAATVRLAECGARVLLLESSPRLGGRATSYVDARSGEPIDNCQHVALGACVNYIDLCRRLGVAGLFSWSTVQTWIEPGGRRSVLRAGPLPAPFHGAPSFSRAAFLAPEDRAGVARALRYFCCAERSQLAGRTLGSVLDALGQTPGAVRRFWSPLIVSACNLGVGRVDAAVGAHVIQGALLGPRSSGAIGVPRVPLGELYAGVADRIADAGGAVRFGASVARVQEDGAELVGGERVGAGRVVLAVTPDRAARLLPGTDPRAEDCGALGFSPILGVHLKFDREVLDVPHAVLLDVATQWLFRRDFDGRVVHAVISAADDWMDSDETAIIGRVVEDIRRCLPGAGAASLVWARTIKSRRATFSATPEGERRRPPASIDGSGVVLAGDFTRTGWPATMEGAVRSGYAAAAEVLGKLPERMVLPDVDVPILVRTIRALGRTLSADRLPAGRARGAGE